MKLKYIKLLLLLFCYFNNVFCQNSADLFQNVLAQYNLYKDKYQQKFSNEMLGKFKKQQYKYCTQDSIDRLLSNSTFVYIPQFFISYKKIKENNNKNLLSSLEFNTHAPFAGIYLIKDSVILMSYEYIHDFYYVMMPMDEVGLHIGFDELKFEDSGLGSKLYIEEKLSPELLFGIVCNGFHSFDLESVWWILKNNNLIACDKICVNSGFEAYKFYGGQSFLDRIFQK